MRKQLFAWLAVTVLTFAGSTAAYAQAPVTTVLVPFEFIVGDTVLPAGAYVVTSIFSGGATLCVRSRDGKSGAVAMVNLADTPGWSTDATISFVKIGGQYFLSTVRTPGMKAQVIRLSRPLAAALATANGTEPVRRGGPTLR